MSNPPQSKMRGMDLLRHSTLLSCLLSRLNGFRCKRSGHGHVLNLGRSLLRDTKVELRGQNCVIECHGRARLWDCSIKIVGHRCRLIINDNCALRGVTLVVEDSDSEIVIGQATSMTRATLIAQEGRQISIGDDCMIAQHAVLRTSDSHNILDGSSGQRINPPADIRLGDHVWVGLGSHVFAGASLESGCIVGAGSFIKNSTIPAAALVVGRPAKVVRSGVQWCRERTLNEACNNTLNEALTQY